MRFLDRSFCSRDPIDNFLPPMFLLRPVVRVVLRYGRRFPVVSRV